MATFGTTARIFLPFAAGYFLSYVFRTINAVIADRLATDLSLDAAHLGMLTSAYFLAFAAVQLPIGTALDRYGPRRVQSILLVLAAIGAALLVRDHSAKPIGDTGTWRGRRFSPSTHLVQISVKRRRRCSLDGRGTMDPSVIRARGRFRVVGDRGVCRRSLHVDDVDGLLMCEGTLRALLQLARTVVNADGRMDYRASGL
jgi:hypothetical protein